MAKDDKKNGNGKAAAKPSETVTVAFVMHKLHADYVNANVTEDRSKFIRDAVLAAIEKMTGKKRPDAPELVRGARTPLSLAARKAGMKTAEFTKKMALQAIGAK